MGESLDDGVKRAGWPDGAGVFAARVGVYFT
jgi:hypothetical protein